MPMVNPGLSSITQVPIHLIVGLSDTHCSLLHAERIKKEIGGAVKNIETIPGATHGYFESATGKDYVDIVDAQLAADDHKVYMPKFHPF